MPFVYQVFDTYMYYILNSSSMCSLLILTTLIEYYVVCRMQNPSYIIFYLIPERQHSIITNTIHYWLLKNLFEKNFFLYSFYHHSVTTYIILYCSKSRDEFTSLSKSMIINISPKTCIVHIHHQTTSRRKEIKYN